MKPLLLPAVLLALAAPCLHAQTAKKTPVRFTCTCDDATGQTFATAFRDLLVTSPRFSGVSVVDRNTYQIRAVTVDASTENNGAVTAIAVVYLLGETYLHLSVEMCGRNRASSCASDILASFDQTINGQ
jgi:hypothetical protein